MFELRKYQVPPYEAGVKFFNQPEPQPGIIVAPTAFGKSILIAHIASDIKGKTLIVQPSKELLEQNYKKYVALGGRASIFSASAGQKRFGETTYATIGSIYKIGDNFRQWGYTNLIIDEVHLYPRNVDSMLGEFLNTSGIKKVLGLTATPFKLQSNMGADGQPFSKLQMLTSRSKKGQFFKEIIHITQIQEITELGFWSKLIYQTETFDDSDLVFNSTKADYTEQSLEISYERQDLEGKVIRAVNSLDRKCGVIFVPTIAEAESLASKIKSCYAVHSKLDKDKRDWIINNFKAGKIKCVANVNILAVGFDHPDIDFIIGARPTASLAWLYQAIGRGTRISPHKEDCLIIDFVGNTEKFGRLEELYFKKEKTWKLYGEGGKLLTGIALHRIGDFVDGQNEKAEIVMEFGKYKGTAIAKVPKFYLKWMLENFTFKEHNKHLKQAAERILAISAV